MAIHRIDSDGASRFLCTGGEHWRRNTVCLFLLKCCCAAWPGCACYEQLIDVKGCDNATATALFHGRHFEATGRRYIFTRIHSVCSGGLVKPDIVFFGEDLPDRFANLIQEDFAHVDLLLVSKLLMEATLTGRSRVFQIFFKKDADPARWEPPDRSPPQRPPVESVLEKGRHKS